MRLSLIYLMSTLILSGCSFGPKIVPPTANNALDALRAQDDTVVQVKLHQCIQQNMVGEADAPQQFYDFDCRLSVERFDSVLNQSFVKQEQGILNFRSGQWQIELSYRAS